MTWWGWILLAVYLGGFLLTWRVAAWVIANDGAYGAIDGDDIAFGMFLGLFVACVWPILVPGYKLYHAGILYGTGRAVIAPPRHMRKELELREREERIRRLEIEAGIRNR